MERAPLSPLNSRPDIEARYETSTFPTPQTPKHSTKKRGQSLQPVSQSCNTVAQLGLLWGGQGLVKCQFGCDAGWIVAVRVTMRE
jgi:hypothetical protein